MNFSSQNMNLHIKDAVAYLTFKELEKVSFVSHSFSTRLGGVSTGNFKSMNLGFKTKDSIDNIYENYRLFCETIGTKRENMSFLNQVHGTNIKLVSNENISELGEFDGSITNIPGITLVTLHSDCAPIFAVDCETKSIGLAHAGWRGTVDNIAKELINSMIINFNSKPENILCFIGPSIHKCCFEIQEDIVDQFEKNSKELISRKDNKVYADIVECNRINLIREGVREENIVNSDLCTKCNSDFLFSYRSKGCQSLNHGVMIATLCIK